LILINKYIEMHGQKNIKKTVDNDLVQGWGEKTISLEPYTSFPFLFN